MSKATERRILSYLISLIKCGYIPLERAAFDFVSLEGEDEDV